MPRAYLEKNYWHIVLFSHKKCLPGSIRRHDVGVKGWHLRQACVKASTKRWKTQSWLVPARCVKVVKGRKGWTLSALDLKTQRILQSIRSNHGWIRVE